MAKKNLKLAKSSAKKSSKKTVERQSFLQYAFVKNPKDAPADDTIMGAVLAGIRKIKSGDLDAATAATVKAGFGSISDQDPREKTRIMLRRLANIGAVRVTRDGAEKSGNKTSKKVKKTFKLKKS